MKILYLTGQIKYIGGIEKVLSLKLNYLADKLKEDVFLLTYEQGNNRFVYPISSNVKWEDLHLDYDTAIRKKRMFAPSNIIKGIRHFFLLRRKIKDIQPDIIIIPNGGGYDYFFLPFIFKYIPKIREIHSSLYRRNNKKKSVKMKLRENIERFFESKYTCVVALNDDEKSLISNSSVEVIPNPVSFIVQRGNVSLQSNKFMAAGRLCYVKGYDTLIKVWKEVINFDPNLKLHIYGSGEAEYIGYLQHLIDHLSLSNNVKLLGSVSDLTQRMEHYSAFICSSHTECFPMVLLEAFSVGLPVISFDCPFGPRHIITHGRNGFLVPDQDGFKLRESIIQYTKLDNEIKKQFSEAASNRANDFQIENVMNKWIILFKKLIYNESA